MALLATSSPRASPEAVLRLRARVLYIHARTHTHAHTKEKRVVKEEQCVGEATKGIEAAVREKMRQSEAKRGAKRRARGGLSR